ncbi:MAG: dethiobiotin synthase [Verrucomicrobiota bacterium]
MKTCSTLFVAGTDTDVGKTFVSSRLISKLKGLNINVSALKPIECGGHDDSLALQSVTGAQTREEVNPIHIELPVAPLDPRVGGITDEQIDSIKAAHRHLEEKSDLVLVEGAGGWQVPISEGLGMQHLAAMLTDQVLLIAKNQLGVLNHTSLTVDAIERQGLSVFGIILNQFDSDPADESIHKNEQILRTMYPHLSIWQSSDLDAAAEAIQQRLIH